jgi:UDP-GlcNAc:undecaprenyl-phosphate GlcNAc-1-phosphate transferase
VNALTAVGAIVSFATCLALTPVVRCLSIHFGVVDPPGPLKIHSRPVSRLGGVAIVISIAAGFVVLTRLDLSSYAFALLALTVMWLAGIADDLWTISPRARLAAQIATGVVLWIGGWRFLVGSVFPRTGMVSLMPVCGLVVLLANSLNFFDGSDGLAAGVSGIVAAAYLLASHRLLHDPFAVSVAACLAGSCAAFLFYNFPPAGIFLGDSGSTLLGFCVALLALTRPPTISQPGSVVLAPLLAAALPITDAAFALARRIRASASPFAGDRRHVYDLMLARGWSTRRVALVCYAITTLLSLIAWTSMRIGAYGSTFVWVTGVVSLLVFEGWFGALQPGREGSHTNSVSEASSERARTLI